MNRISSSLKQAQIQCKADLTGQMLQGSPPHNNDNIGKENHFCIA